ncbi:MAG: hypothetical protein KAH01_06365 [Caldisericia bacterium]|nr:hypothetical protein [Caldisericia bacterium]
MKTMKTMLVAGLCVMIFFSALSCSKKNVQDHANGETEFVDSVYQCLGPYGGRIDNIEISSLDARVYLASSGGHAFISYDAGGLWKLIPISTSRISSFEFDTDNKDIFYISDQDAIWETNDFGKTWNPMLLPESIKSPFYSFNINNKAKFISSSSGLFQKKEEEKKWENIFSCIEGEAPLESVSFSSREPSLIAGIAGGRNVFVSVDNGLTWTGTESKAFKNNILLDIKIHPFDYSKIFVLYPGGVFCSSDNGLTWENKTEENLPITAYQINISSTGVIYACTQEGIWQSLNQGVSWNFISGFHDATYSITTNLSGQTILAGSAKGLNLYSVSSQIWTNKNIGITAIPIETVNYHPLEYQQFVVRTFNDKSYQYFLPSDQWSGISTSFELDSIFGDRNNFKLWYGIDSEKIYKSENLNSEWIQYSIIPTQSPIQNVWVNPIQSTQWIAGTSIDGFKPGSGILLSNDEGFTWNQNIEELAELAITNICFDAVNPNQLYCIGMTNIGLKNLYSSSNGGMNWKQIEEIQNVQTINCGHNNSGYIWVVNKTGEVYFSKDSATSWEKITDLKNIASENLLKYPDGFKIVCTGNEGELILHVYRGTFLLSQDFGKNWIELKGVPDFSYNDFIVHTANRNLLYIASDIGLVQLTLDR